jgi:predicted RND superfamily exporter protein
VHRRLFRKQLKKTLVSSADRIAKVALAGVALLSTGTASLVFDVAVGRNAGVIAGGGVLAAMVLLLVLVPTLLLKRASKD